MNEFGDQIRKMASSFSNRFLNTESRRKDHASRQLASEAVLLFANAENQQPIVSYSSASPSEFDLTKINPGSLFRLETSNEKFGSYYNWYVVGSVEGNNVHVYEIWHRNRREVGLELKQQSRLGRSWMLHELKPYELHFKISDSYKVLHGLKKVDPTNIDVFHVARLDLMSSGAGQKIIKPSKVNTTTFQPITLPKTSRV